MGLLKYALVIGIISAVAYYYYCPCHHVELKPIKTGWWGKGSKANYKEDESIRKFTINVSEKVLLDLKDKLKTTIYPEPLENANFEYGFNSDYLKKVVNYWTTKYDWKSQETKINAMGHYKTQIDGLDVHFMHVKPKSLTPKLKVIPIILVHGWPGSFVEYIEVAKLLTTPDSSRDYVFEVIVPSIPGYGFSEASHQMGFSQMEAAYVFDKLMQRLGYSTYYAHGGDWGSMITRNMAIQYPERVKGLHITMVPVLDTCTTIKMLIGTVFPSLVLDEKDYKKVYPLKDLFIRVMRETGHMHIHATKPDAIGMGLVNSPAGLAAYILGKFSAWTNPAGYDAPDGLLTQKFTMDQLLTNVMVYYVTNSITSSMRFYKEWVRNSYQRGVEKHKVLVPSGYAAFPNELIVIPENFAKGGFKNLVSYTDMERGGHFGGFEEPQLLSRELWKFVDLVEKLPKEQSK